MHLHLVPFLVRPVEKAPNEIELEVGGGAPETDLVRRELTPTVKRVPTKRKRIETLRT